MSRLRVERRGVAFLVGIDRPEKRNALDEQMVSELHDVLDQADSSPCVLVFYSTTPGMFMAGSDIGELARRDADAALRGVNLGLMERIERHRWPSVAVVEGEALGAGCELALAADLRLASSEARFGQPELSLGIIAGAGANWRLPRLVGLARARRMLYLGEMLSAEEALACGLVDKLHELGKVVDAACALAEEIALRPWRALELTKLALRMRSEDTSLFDIAAQAILFESDEKKLRMQAFLQKGRSREP